MADLSTEKVFDPLNPIGVKIPRKVQSPLSWLIQTKISPPLTRGCIEREHLKRQLDTLLGQGSRTLFVSAPAGYGKSTLLAQWLGSQSKVFCWYSFDSSDDSARLARHLGERLRQLSLYDDSRSSDLEQIASQLSALDTSLVLVFDDLHLNKDPQIHAFLEHLVSNPTSGLSLILSSREAPPPYLTKFFPQESFQIWSADHLALNKTETREILQLSGIKLNTETMKSFFEQTEGWPAAVQLLRLATPKEKAWDKLVRDLPLTHSGMWDYLANEVLSTVERETKYHMIRLSLLERFNRFVAHSVGIDIDLSILPSWGPFLVELEDNERMEWFRFHHLLGHFLRQLAELHLSESERKDFHITASRWFEKNGFFEEAVQQSLAAGDWDRAQALLSSEDAIERIVHHYSAAQHWFEVLPPQRINNDWLLCTNLGTIYGLLGRLSEARDFFQRALEDDACEELYLCLSGLAFCQAGLGEERVSQEYLTLARAQKQAFGPSRALGQFFIACVDLYRGDAHSSLSGLNQVIQDSSLKSIVVESSCQIVKAHALFYRGLLQESLRVLDLFLASIQSTPGERERNRLNDKVAAAWGLRARVSSQLGHWNEAETAWNNFEEAKETHGVPHFFPPLACAKVRHLMRRGRLADAREYLNRHLNLPGQISQSLVRALQAELLASEGKAEEALGLLKEWIKGLKERERSAFYHLRLYIARVLCTLELSSPGNLGSLTRDLELIVDQAEQDGRTWDKIHFLFLLSKVKAKEGKLQRCRTLVQEALDQGRPLGFVEVFLDDSYSSELARDLDPSLPQTVGAPKPRLELEARELQILQLMKEGLSNQEIADKIFLGLHTVKWYNRKLYKKLGVKRRTQALKKFQELSSPGSSSTEEDRP